MTNQKIALLIIALIILGGGAFVFLNSKSKTSNQDLNQNQERAQEMKKAQKEIKKIMSLDPNKGIKCEQVADVGKDNKVNTVIYFYKNKIRYDVNLDKETQGQKDFHMINDGEYSYIWGKSMMASAFTGLGGGLKMKNNNEAGEEMKGEMDIDVDELREKNYTAPNVKCEQWSPDSDLFEIPSDIDFKDMENLMPGMNENKVLSNTSDTCSLCDMIPDEKTREECKTSCHQDDDED